MTFKQLESLLLPIARVFYQKKDKRVIYGEKTVYI